MPRTHAHTQCARPHSVLAHAHNRMRTCTRAPTQKQALLCSSMDVAERSVPVHSISMSKPMQSSAYTVPTSSTPRCCWPHNALHSDSDTKLDQRATVLLQTSAIQIGMHGQPADGAVVKIGWVTFSGMKVTADDVRSDYDQCCGCMRYR